MANYAIHDGAIVRNVIVADSQELAEQITGSMALETNGEPWIAWEWQDGAWRHPRPGPNYVWDSETQDWVLPPSPVQE